MLTEVSDVSCVPSHYSSTASDPVLWAAPEPSLLLGYMLFLMDTENEHRLSVSSEYKVPPEAVLKVAIARQDNSHGDLSGQTVVP